MAVRTVADTPRERLLATARRLFYADGIHAVGVDRLVTEADVTPATFRHFPTEEALIEAYPRATDADLRRGWFAETVTGLLHHVNPEPEVHHV